MLEIKINTKNVISALERHPHLLANALRNAVNTTSTALQKAVKSKLKTDINLDDYARLLHDRRGRSLVRVKRAGQSEATAIISYLGASSRYANDRPGLAHYRHHDEGQRNLRVKGWRPSVQIRKSDPIRRVERGFYGVGKLAGQGLFERVNDKHDSKLVRRTGPSIRQILDNPEILAYLHNTVMPIFAQKLEAAIEKQVLKI